jgi:hypothetical protein
MKKNIVLNCYTDRRDVYENAPIIKANRALPKYFHNLPKYSELNSPFDGTTGNLRGCSGYTDLFGKGFVIPMWSDMATTVGARCSKGHFTEFADEHTMVDEHTQEQRGDWLPDDDYLHHKIRSPWIFECDTDIDWHWSGMPWTMEDITDYTVLPGVLNFNKSSDTNVNIMTKRHQDDRRLFIPYGQPLVHLVPITERKVEVKIHLITREEFMHKYQRNAPCSFNLSYQKANSRQKKCPFSGKFKI